LLCIACACGGLRAQTPGWQPLPGHTQIPIWPGTVPDAQPAPGAEVTATAENQVAGKPWHYVEHVSRPTGQAASSTTLRLDVAFLVDFGRGAEDEPALFAVHASELLGEEAELARGFLVEAPEGGGLLFGDAQLFDGNFIVGEELVQRHFQGAREFFERLDGRNGAAIFQAREVTAKQAGAFLDVALREVLGFAKPSEPFADYHGESLQYSAVPTQ
jgi:hypothetical protein